MKVLPYKEETCSKYRTESVQEFWYVLSEQIRQKVCYATLVKNNKTSIKSNAVVMALKHWIQKQGYHL